MTVYIIGAGCGDKGLLTSHSAEIIDKCGTVIGPERLAEKYADEKKAAYQKIMRNNAPPARNTPAPRAYVQGNHSGQPPKPQANNSANAKGCLSIAIVVIVVLIAIFSKLME